MYDLIIIGAGPAGMSAAVYAARAELDFIVIEGSMMQGGQVLTTYDVDNYLGLPGIGGFEMGMKFAEHAKKLGVSFVTENVISMDAAGEVKKVVTDKKEYEAKTIIIATGAVHRKAGIPGEAEFTGKGESYCATCDGAFFRNKNTAVVGGGDVALEDALYLSNICKNVYLIHRRDGLRGAKVLQNKVMEKENITFMPFYEVTKICGQNKVEAVELKHNQTGETKTIELSGVFIAIGMEPQSSLVKDLVKEDPAGYVEAGEDCRTSADGIYVAGDVRSKSLRQVVTAVADGAVAIASIEQDFARE